MAKILENRPVADGFHLMRVESDNDAKMGQFYMLRAWDRYPVLSRPISVFDSDGKTVSFLYKVVGQGTEIFLTRNNVKTPVNQTGQFFHGKVAWLR